MNNVRFRLDYFTCVFLLGVFALTPIITITYGERDIAVFRVLFFGILLYLLSKLVIGRKIVFGKNIKLFIIWLIEGIFACFCGWFFLKDSAPQFSDAAFSYLFKVTAFLIFTFAWVGQEKKQREMANEYLIYGLLIGCIINLIWASIDGIGFYLTGTSINNSVFLDYAQRHNIRYGTLSLITNSGLFRSGGLNNDPAQVGFIAPIIVYYALYCKKYIYIVLALLGILASASTTALVSSFLVSAFYYLNSVKRKPFQIKRRTIVNTVLIMVTGFLVVFFLFYSSNTVFNTMIDRFVNRINVAHLETIESNIRLKYLFYAPIALINLGINGIFGLGFGTASYGYVYDNYILQSIGRNNFFAYDPENTYVAYLLDTGIVGFLLFIIYVYIILKYYLKRINSAPSQFELLIFSMLLSTVISMLFYHYVLFTPQVLITLVALTNIDFKNRKASHIKAIF